MRLFLDLALGCALCLLAWGGLRPTNASAPSRDKRQAAVYFRQSGASRFQTGQEEGEGGPRWSTPGGRSTSSSQVHDPGPPTRRARQPIRFVDDAEASAPFKFNAEDVGQLEGRSRQYESSPLRFEHGDHPRLLDYGRSDPPVTQYRHNSKDATRPESRSGSTGGFRFHDDDDDDRREPEDGSRQRALSSFRFNDEDRFSEGRPSSDSTFRFDNDAGGVEGRSNSGSFQSYGTAEHSYFSSTPDTLKFNFASSEERAPSFKVEERSKESDDEPFFRSKESSDEPFFRSKESSDEPFFRSKESSSSGFGSGFFANSSSDQSKSSGEFAGRSPKPFRDRGRQSKVSAVFDSPSAGPGFESSWEQPESPRHLSPDTLATITETLGAINTVGRYLVNYTRGGRPRPPGLGLGLGLMPDRLDPPPTRSGEDLPGAILTISKNVLGRNVTDSIAPLVRVLPIGTENSPGGGGGGRACTTPGGESGRCDDLSNCPQLLLDLANLRQSICFKSLFVPGVCCPHRQSQSPQSNDNTFLTESTTTYRPVILTSAIPLATHQSYYTTTPTPTPPPNSIDYDFDSSGGGGECGVQNVPKFRVVGGEEALPGRWPWMAAIFLHGPRRTEFWCGGSLIGAKHVLTAAHCTKDTRQRPFQARQFTVRLGDIDLRRGDEPSSPQTYRVAEVRAHARFSRVGFYNDIAVLVLDKPVRRSRYVIPVCLPTPSSRNNHFIGEQPTVVGWGTTYYGGKESTVQRQVALPVWKNEDCDRTYFQPINENFICAGLKEGGKDACQGDSGGPLILKKNGRWMQIGIVSFGNKCGEPGYPGVYTRVTRYLDWITTNTIT